ncbi:hypothetical protein MCEGE10_02445 [Flavobacteriaceae bacterium]
MLFDFLFSDSNSTQNISIMTERARLFVEKVISENDIRFMKNILHYYLSTRESCDSMENCIIQTIQKDALVINACEYFDIIPPISQNIYDFSSTLQVFIDKLFSIEQIRAFTIKDAINHLLTLG